MEVPPFPDTPHICQKDFPGVLIDRALYVRTDNNESAPVRSSADFRSVIGRAVRNKSDELLQSMSAVLKGSSAVAKPIPYADYDLQIEDSRQTFANRNPLPNKGYDFFFETSFCPAIFGKRRFDVQKLRQSAFGASVDFIGMPFLLVRLDRPEILNVFEEGIESFVYADDFSGGKILDFWRLYQSGLFYKRELPWNALQQPDVAIYPNVAQYFGLAVDCLTRLYEPLLEPTESIRFRAVITGTNGRRMVNGAQGLPLWSNYTSRISSIEVERSHPLAEWKANLQDFAAEMMYETQTRFNWIPQSSQGAKDVINRTLLRLL
jgi:hypothetical protein